MTAHDTLNNETASGQDNSGLDTSNDEKKTTQQQDNNKNKPLLTLNNKHSITSINSNSANNSNSRPKLYTMCSSDNSSGFPTLDKLENSTLLQKRSSKITVEPVVFANPAVDSNNSTLSANNKKGGSQASSLFFFFLLND